MRDLQLRNRTVIVALAQQHRAPVGIGKRQRWRVTNGARVPERRAVPVLLQPIDIAARGFARDAVAGRPVNGGVGLGELARPRLRNREQRRDLGRIGECDQTRTDVAPKAHIERAHGGRLCQGRLPVSLSNVDLIAGFVHIVRKGAGCRLPFGQQTPRRRHIVQPRKQRALRHQQAYRVAGVRTDPIGRVGEVTRKQCNLRLRLPAHLVKAAMLVRRELVIVAQREDDAILGEARFLVTEEIVVARRHHMKHRELRIEANADPRAGEREWNVARCGNGRFAQQRVGIGMQLALTLRHEALGRRQRLPRAALKAQIVDMIDGIEGAEHVFGRALLNGGKIGPGACFRHRGGAIQ